MLSVPCIRTSSCATRNCLTYSALLVPVYLCPALLRPSKLELSSRSIFFLKRQCKISGQVSRLHTDIRSGKSDPSRGNTDIALLPVSCPGCGAFVQTTEPQEAGFYTNTRKAVKVFTAQKEVATIPRNTTEDVVYKKALQNAESSLLQEMGLANLSALNDSPCLTQDSSKNPPLCDRCHNLVHHHSGVPIHHPSIQSIRDTISESPHKFNHIYHVLDAADFPLSLIPNIHRLLSAAPQRSKNRRSKTSKFYKDRSITLSFIITRSDLLAPKKEQVDSLMPYLVRVLRDSLGPAGDDIRLGNVRCVSAKRGWWTKDIKEAIWNYDGGSWMVGKVNVGKSRLFEAVFPKGRTEELRYTRPKSLVEEARLEDGDGPGDMGASQRWVGESEQEGFGNVDSEEDPERNAELNEASLLPPAQPETAFPVMPVISSLPGTTASPIRHSFKNGRGELIDLPGLSRGKLFSYVRDEHQVRLTMCSRLKPEQNVLKPGQSLLLGGLIRITPTTPDLTFLTCAFVPIGEHVTSTEKAIGMQTQQRESGVLSIAKPGTGEKIASAGKFKLKWDVTKRRAGPITSPAAVGLRVEKLPYRIFSTDILIEGCGWVEIVAQIRKRQIEQLVTSGSEGGMMDNTWDEGAAHEREDIYPEIEVFSPEGKGIGARMPMNAWTIGVGEKRTARKKARPRPSMKGAKKREKMRRRSESGT